MGKAIAYLIVVLVGVLLLRSTGLFDGMGNRGNLQERDAFWQKTASAEAPAGTAKAAVEALAARHGVVLDCFSSSLTPPVTECSGDDPTAKGGTAGHPVTLRLNFTFHGDALAAFETSRRVIQ
ncbi:hypothetical protein QE400_004159 [Xanthomonas sacchari]|uniref:hypothetical protein n=1 Tax=Xanthomonas sacchari TaxID=56458 RepID=UPI00278481CC|nr:hypothetical protein [Xanthomonas sacchari]MDQ1094746.1 hypothetical protein [Xanthomonas sacchari]